MAHRLPYVALLIAAMSIARAESPTAAPSPAPIAASTAAAPPDALEAIVVKSDKLNVETLIDRKVYTMGADAQSTFGSLSDILSNIPSVDVDPSGIVALRGDTKVLILVDGKPSTQFSGPAAGDNLQSLPAEDIERIEILTTPPAQFKADGAAGIINIITRKRRRAGTSGAARASGGLGGRDVLGVDAGHVAGPLSLSAAAGYRTDVRDRTVRSSLIAPDPVTGQPIDSRTAIDERIRRATPTAKLSAEIAIDDRQRLSASASWANRGGLRTYTETNESLAPGGVVSSDSRRLSSGHDPETDLDQTLGFSRQLARAGETLDFSLHRSTSRQHERYDYTDDSFIPPSPTVYDNLSFQEMEASTGFGADYALPLAPSRSLKLGYAFEQDDYRFDNVGGSINPGTGMETLDSNLTNEFKFRQRIHALYASLQTHRGSWTGLGGLRLETVTTDAEQLTDDVATRGHYLQMYPSLHLDRSLSKRSTLSFGASRRVTRPDPEDLNPYVDHEYTPNLNQGNPTLRPEYSTSFEAGYGYEGGGRSYGVTTYYRRNHDTVTDVTRYFAGGLSIATKTNLPRDTAAGLEWSANGRLFPWLTYALSGNLFHDQIDATALGIGGLQSTTGLNAKAKLDYRPTDAASAQMTFARTDRRLTPQGFVGPIDLVNLGFTYRVNSTLSALATVTDLFNGQQVHRFSSSPAFIQDYRRATQGRILLVGLTVSFGSIHADKQPELEYDSAVGK